MNGETNLSSSVHFRCLSFKLRKLNLGCSRWICHWHLMYEKCEECGTKYVCERERERSTNLELQFELVFHALVVVPTCPFPKRPSRIRFDRKPIIIIGFIVLYVLDKRLIFGLQTFRPLGRSRTCLSKNNSSKRNKSSFQFLVPVLLLYVPAFKDRRGIF